MARWLGLTVPVAPDEKINHRNEDGPAGRRQDKKSKLDKFRLLNGFDLNGPRPPTIETTLADDLRRTELEVDPKDTDAYCQLCLEENGSRHLIKSLREYEEHLKSKHAIFKCHACDHDMNRR